MENRRESLINLVSIDRCKGLHAPEPKGKGSRYRALTLRYAVHDSPGGEAAPHPSGGRGGTW